MMKVVVIEDEDLFRKEIVCMTPWEKLGCTMAGEASNGFEGLALARKLMPDIIVTDIRMPGMDGLTMIGELEREKKPGYEPRYIIISGHDDFQYARKAITYGVKSYILKPVDDLELYDTIRKASSDLKRDRELRKLKSGIDEISDSRIMLWKEYLAPDDTSIRERYVENAVEFIRDHYREDISIADAAFSLHLCESYLSRLFKAESGFTFLEYLTNFRLRKAVELLHDKSVKIYEVSEQVGYRDSRYFSVLFKKFVGVTPNRFKDGLNAR